jgi:hypothetical protein
MTELIHEFWKKDPEPAKTLAIQAEISAAVEQGAADFLPEDVNPLTRRAQHCPWPGVLYAKTSLSIAGKALARGDSFVFTVGSSADGFERTIVSYTDGANATSDLRM